MAIMTGLSGNEMYCLHLKGFEPGEMVIGNSVFSMGFVGSLGAGLQTMAGGEIAQVTEIIHEGRQSALERMVKEAEKEGGIGITGVSSELIWQGSNVEFLSIGSCIHHEGKKVEKLVFLLLSGRAGVVLPVGRRIYADKVCFWQCRLLDWRRRRDYGRVAFTGAGRGQGVLGHFQ